MLREYVKLWTYALRMLCAIFGDLELESFLFFFGSNAFFPLLLVAVSGFGHARLLRLRHVYVMMLMMGYHE